MDNKVTNFKLLTTLFGIVLISSMIFVPSYVYAGEATLNSLDDKLDTINDNVLKLIDGQESFYNIEIEGITVDNGAVGIFVDCTGETADTDDTACVFTIDSIRYDQTEFIEKDVPAAGRCQSGSSCTELKTVPGKVLGVCIDFVNSGSDKPFSNCSPTTIVTGGVESSAGFSAGPGVGVGGGSGVEIEVSAGIEWAFSNGVSTLIRDPVQIPLPEQFNLGDRQVGGNVLIDSGLGEIFATKFVIIKHQDFIGKINIIGTKNANMKLVVGIDTEGEPTCKLGSADTTCNSEFSDALKDTADIAGVENIDFQQENAFGVTNVVQNNAGQSPQIRTVGLSDELPSFGLAQLLNGHEDELQAVIDLRNDVLVDLIDLDDIDMILENAIDENIDQKLEDLIIKEVDKLPGLTTRLIDEIKLLGLEIDLTDLTEVIKNIQTKAISIEEKVIDIQSDITDIPNTVTTEVDRIIAEIQSVFG